MMIKKGGNGSSDELIFLFLVMFKIPRWCDDTVAEDDDSDDLDHVHVHDHDAMTTVVVTMMAVVVVELMVRISTDRMTTTITMTPGLGDYTGNDGRGG